MGEIIGVIGSYSDLNDTRMIAEKVIIIEEITGREIITVRREVLPGTLGAVSGARVWSRAAEPAKAPTARDPPASIPARAGADKT